MRPTRDFNVGLRNGLLEPKHYLAMRGDALWLYSLLLDRQTRRLDKDGLGQVTGGVPISDADTAGAFGCERRTVSRWRRKLVRGGYVTARRTPYGYVYAITKPKKWKKTDGIEPVHHSPPSDGTEAPREDTSPPREGTRPVQTKKRCQETQEKQEQESATAAVSQDQMEKELQVVWSHYLGAFDKHETLSPSARKMGIAVLSELRQRFPAISSETCVEAMTAAIDRARHLVKNQPKKSFFARWHAIFSKFETFFSLWEEE